MITTQIISELEKVLPVLPTEIWLKIEDYLLEYYRNEHKRVHGRYLQESFNKTKYAILWMNDFDENSFIEAYSDDSTFTNIQSVIRYMKQQWILHDKEINNVYEHHGFTVFPTNWDIFVRINVFDRVGYYMDYDSYDGYSGYLKLPEEKIEEFYSHKWIVKSQNKGPFQRGKRLLLPCHRLGWRYQIQGVKMGGYTCYEDEIEAMEYGYDF